jgi:23S rRNA (guanosine2251-2'-O)-methyltransferase
MAKRTGKDRPQPPRGWRPEDVDDRPSRPTPGAGQRPAPGRAAQRSGTRSLAPEDRLALRHGRQALYGFHSVSEAIANPRRKVHVVYATANAAQRLSEMMPGAPVQLAIVKPEAIDSLVGVDAVHQGVAAEVEPLPPMDIHDIPAEGIVLVLDQITDPHNVGAILRSAAAFGVKALVLTERNSPQTTGVLAKIASGGLEHVPLVTVGNLAQALTALGERGFWRIGLDSDGPTGLDAAIAAPPVALVLGAEGKGLRRLTRERCDVLARLDVPGAIRSLNVSNAAAVALYALNRAVAPVATTRTIPPIGYRSMEKDDAQSTE